MNNSFVSVIDSLEFIKERLLFLSAVLEERERLSVNGLSDNFLLDFVSDGLSDNVLLVSNAISDLSIIKDNSSSDLPPVSQGECM